MSNGYNVTPEEAERMLPYAVTELQRTMLEAIRAHGSIRQATIAMGYPANSGAVSNAWARIKARASAHGLSPESGWDHPTPQSHIAKGVSRYFKLDDGGIWVKADLKQEERENLIREALEAFHDQIPKAKPVARERKVTDKDLLNLYTITDFHLGMYAWHEESGDDWDLKIAEDTLLGWFDEAVSRAPRAEQAVFCQLGDFLHWDGLEAVTPTSKHILDADTRYQKVVRVAIRVLRQCVNRLLTKYERVHIIQADANHDPAGSAWLREAFAVFYEDEPRVTVETSPMTFYAYEWGQTSLYWHHGHRVRPDKLGETFASTFRDLFGRTKFAYGHSGHYHHKIVVEKSTMPVEQHRTLAAKDNYAASHGYMAGRDAQVITYSKRFGEVSRIRVSPEMLEAREEA